MYDYNLTDNGLKGVVIQAETKDSGTEALKFDNEKPDPTMIPMSAVIGEAKALGFGANKYGRSNWKKGMDWMRPAGAALRHLYAWISGEDIDPESGLNHLYHVKCNISFLIEYQEKGLGNDNR